MKDGSRDLSVEHSLDKIENDFQGVLRAIRRRQQLTSVQRAKLCVFTAAMMGRSKKQGDHMQKQWAVGIEQIRQIEGQFGSAAHPALSEVLEEVNKNSHAYLVNDTIEVAPVLFIMPLTILTTNDLDGFITSDAPAVMCNPKAYTMSPMLRQPGLMQTDIEVTLPLSPQETVFFSHKPSNRLYTPTSTSLLEEVNRRTFFWADAEFVSWKGTVKDAWCEEREAPPDAWRAAE